MGCCAAASITDAEVVRATKDYFDLTDLPISVKAVPKVKGIEVHGVGFAADDILLSFEIGFERRRFWIKDATVNVQRGLFTAAFDLVPQGEGIDTEMEECSDACNHVEAVWLQEAPPVQENAMLNSPSMRGLTRGLSVIVPVKSYAIGFMSPSKSYQTHEKPLLHIEDACDARAQTARQLARVDHAAARLGAVIRVTLMRRWCPGIRASVTRALAASGLRVVVARLSIVNSLKERTIKDTFWLADRQDGGQRLSGLLEKCPQWLSDLSSSLRGVTAFPASPAEDRQPSNFDVTDAGAESAEALRELPQSLREEARGLPYRLHATDGGAQFDGLAKFCGAGMNKAEDGSDVLEFHTYFVRPDITPTSERPRFSMWSDPLLRRLAGGAKAFAQTVTQYDPVRRRLTIFKVFLNDILPAGQRAGMRTTAEQLLCIPAGGHASAWDGAAAVRGLRQLHLCDVVNWNTYSILSMVGKKPETDIEKWLLREELSSVGLAMDDLLTKPVDIIFAKTILGKLVHGVFKEWRRNGVAQHAVSNINVIFSSSKLELVLGEYRPVMDVVLDLQANDEI